MKLYTALFNLFILSSCFTAHSQTDFADFGAEPMRIAVHSGGQQINLKTPLLVKREQRVRNSDDVDSINRWYLEFESETKIAEKQLNRYKGGQQLAGRFLLKLIDRRTGVKSEIIMRKQSVRLRTVYSDVIAEKVNFYYYKIDVSSIPTQLLLDTGTIAITYFELLE